MVTKDKKTADAIKALFKERNIDEIIVKSDEEMSKILNL